MPFAEQTAPVSNRRLWTGRVASALVVLFLALDGLMKFLKPAAVIEACVHLGLPESILPVIGGILLICTALYAYPATSVLGAVLTTGYLGGAVLTHLRVGDPLFSHILFPVYMGIVMWTGLFLRKSRLRTLFYYPGKD